MCRPFYLQLSGTVRGRHQADFTPGLRVQVASKLTLVRLAVPLVDRKRLFTLLGSPVKINSNVTLSAEHHQ